MTTFLTPPRSRREVRSMVLRSLSSNTWRWPAEIARATRLPLHQVRRCLHELAREMLVVGCIEVDSPYQLTGTGVRALLGNPGPTLKTPRRRKATT